MTTYDPETIPLYLYWDILLKEETIQEQRMAADNQLNKHSDGHPVNVRKI